MAIANPSLAKKATKKNVIHVSIGSHGLRRSRIGMSGWGRLSIPRAAQPSGTRVARLGSP